MMLNSGINGKMRGGRRQMLHLGDNETTALARKGKVMQVGSSSKTKPAGLSALGEYSDSDSDSDCENQNGTGSNNGENDEGVITSSIVSDNNIDNEVGSFLNEVNQLSASNSPAREGSSTPPTCTQSNQNKPKTKVSMYKSMFVKGATEWNRKDESKTVPTEFDITELPEEPTSDWQICVDENTQYQYYWNTVSNEVTWTIPSDYTQYLLQYKLYEEQLAKIPNDRREYLQKKKLGLIQSPKIIKPKPSPPKQDREETTASSTPVTVTNNLIGQSVSNGGDPPIKEGLTDPEKQFYSEIEELEKMDIDPPEEKPPMPEELPPLPPMPPPPEVETVKSNGDQSVVENNKPENKGSDSEVNIDLEDIDNALEKALETKKEELKKLEAEETDKPPQLNHPVHNKHKRHSSPDSSIQMSQVAKKRKETVMVEVISRPTPPPSPPVDKPSKQSIDTVNKILVDYEHEETDDDQQGALPSKKNPFVDVDDLSDIEDIKDILESKLEFINTNKKGVTRLQILLIQLQTRYSDYLHGALKKEYFHQRLSKLQTELLEYEKSATPEGWTCQWDRNSRSYFYTDDITGDTQWEHPDSAVQVVSESPHHHRHRHHHHSSQSKSRSSKSHSSKRSKDKRRDDKRSKSKSSRRSERDKDRDRSESPEIIHKSSRNQRKIDLDNIVENISLGGLLSKNREAKTESITIEDDDDDDEDVPAPTASSIQPPLPSDTLPLKTNPVEASNAYNAATSDEDEVKSNEPHPEKSTKPEVVTPFGVIVKLPQYNSSEVSTSSMVDASTAVNSHAANSYAVGPSTGSLVSSSTLFTSAPPPPPPPPQETNEENEPTVSSSEIKNEESQASGSKDTKKKKKDKDMQNTNFSLKKKKVSSLVNKWKKVKIEVEKEEKIEDARQSAIRHKLEEWKKDQP